MLSAPVHHAVQDIHHYIYPDNKIGNSEYMVMDDQFWFRPIKDAWCHPGIGGSPLDFIARRPTALTNVNARLRVLQ